MFWWEVVSGRQTAITCFVPLALTWNNKEGKLWWGKELLIKLGRVGQMRLPTSFPHLLGLAFNFVTIYIFPAWLFSEQRLFQLCMDMVVTLWLEPCFWADFEVMERMVGQGKHQHSGPGICMSSEQFLLPGKGGNAIKEGKVKTVIKSTNDQWIHNGYLKKKFVFFIFANSHTREMCMDIWNTEFRGVGNTRTDDNVILLGPCTEARKSIGGI